MAPLPISCVHDRPPEGGSSCAQQFSLRHRTGMTRRPCNASLTHSRLPRRRRAPKATRSSNIERCAWARPTLSGELGAVGEAASWSPPFRRRHVDEWHAHNREGPAGLCCRPRCTPPSARQPPRTMSLPPDSCSRQERSSLHPPRVTAGAAAARRRVPTESFLFLLVSPFLGRAVPAVRSLPVTSCPSSFINTPCPCRRQSAHCLQVRTPLEIAARHGSLECLTLFAQAHAAADDPAVRKNLSQIGPAM